MGRLSEYSPKDNPYTLKEQIEMDAAEAALTQKERMRDKHGEPQLSYYEELRELEG